MYCVICMTSDQGQPWGILPNCGHVFHQNCVNEALQRNPACPTCRKCVKNKCREHPKVIRLYLDEEAEPEIIDIAEPSHDQFRALQSKIGKLECKLQQRDEDLNDLHCKNKMLESTIADLEERESQLTLTLGATEQRLQQKLNEHNALAQKYSRLENDYKTVKIKLDHEKVAVSRIVVAYDTSLSGDALGVYLRNMAASGSPAPDYFQKLLENRNKKLSEANTRAEKAEIAAATAAAAAQDDIRKLKIQISQLREAMAKMEEEGKKVVNQSAQVTNFIPPSKQSISRDHSEIMWKTLGVENPVGGTLQQDVKTVVHEDCIEIVSDDDQCIHDDRIHSRNGENMDSNVSRNKINDNIHSQKTRSRSTATVLLGAGPSRLAMSAGPGSSFIKNSRLATTGLRDDGTFIHKGPNGKGGTVTFYSSTSTTSNKTNSGQFKRTKFLSSNTSNNSNNYISSRGNI